MNNNMNWNERSALLHKIQAEVFALYEVALYLDAYPNSKKPMKYYQEHHKIAHMLKAEFEEKFGPLTIYNNHNDQKWEWVEGPGPGDKEGN